ncbi:flagellar hook protein [Photobacterium ganghwense]|uniref:Flagellar hook-associated protein 2 n=1 Tax=Photobacterium ganghwense TaxID=320778 RepID=A0A0J1HHC4_9GAMM|nr:flagellar filament capping protein FliD [Photobacterium ganghwense]KLV11013.1 flagellar hook protein [Photobacterium ganghwense]PSU11274.1 flagellar hook protein [Photobacterium ganghwense]QSV13392.1 flagellar filament capping protein FliD [Photobacterium ganghwense]
MGLSVGGLGSGLDVAGMTQQLVAAERTPKQTRITDQMSKVDSSLSAYGLVKSSASSLQELLEKFKEDEAFISKKASSSDKEFISVTADSNTQNGSYSVEVKQLAKSHKIVSNSSFDADPAADLGSGEMVISVGDKSMTINISSDKNSLKDVVAAINNSKDNPGITATTITDDGGSKILFSSTKTGAENQIKIDASGMTGDLANLTYDPASPGGNMAEMQAAQDAQIIIDGFSAVTSSTNKFENAIDGLTLDIKKLTGTYGTGTDTDDIETKSINITIENDKTQPKDALTKFVEQYNSLFEMIESQSSYSVEEGSGGPLVGDSVSKSLISQLRNLINEPVTVDGQKYRMADFGVTTDRYGKLELDEEILGDMLDDKFLDFGAFFTSDGGFLDKADEVLDGFVGRDGSITSKEDSLKEQQKRLEDDMSQLDARMKDFEDRTYKQLSAMDAAIAQMTQELATMQSLLL